LPASQRIDADWSMIPVGAPTYAFSARWASAGRRSTGTSRPPRSISAVSTADSRAADDDTPAPTGTSEDRAIRAGGTSCPASRRAQATPATYAAQPWTAPFVPMSVKVTGSSAKSEHTVHPVSALAAAATTRSGRANGSTKPSL
jgi:hypothetical protein